MTILPKLDNQPLDEKQQRMVDEMTGFLNTPEMIKRLNNKIFVAASIIVDGQTFNVVYFVKVERLSKGTRGSFNGLIGMGDDPPEPAEYDFNIIAVQSDKEPTANFNEEIARTRFFANYNIQEIANDKADKLFIYLDSVDVQEDSI